MDSTARCLLDNLVSLSTQEPLLPNTYVSNKGVGSAINTSKSEVLPALACVPTYPDDPWARLFVRSRKNPCNRLTHTHTAGLRNLRILLDRPCMR